MTPFNIASLWKTIQSGLGYGLGLGFVARVARVGAFGPEPQGSVIIVVVFIGLLLMWEATRTKPIPGFLVGVGLGYIGTFLLTSSFGL